MSQPRTPQHEDITSACAIANYLRGQGKDEEANMVVLFISEWASAAGFAQGLLEMSKLLKEAEG